MAEGYPGLPGYGYGANLLDILTFAGLGPQAKQARLQRQLSEQELKNLAAQAGLIGAQTQGVQQEQQQSKKLFPLKKGEIAASTAKIRGDTKGFIDQWLERGQMLAGIAAYGARAKSDEELAKYHTGLVDTNNRRVAQDEKETKLRGLNDLLKALQPKIPGVKKERRPTWFGLSSEEVTTPTLEDNPEWQKVYKAILDLTVGPEQAAMMLQQGAAPGGGQAPVDPAAPAALQQARGGTASPVTQGVVAGAGRQAVSGLADNVLGPLYNNFVKPLYAGPAWTRGGRAAQSAQPTQPGVDVEVAGIPVSPTAIRRQAQPLMNDVQGLQRALPIATQALQNTSPAVLMQLLRMLGIVKEGTTTPVLQ